MGVKNGEPHIDKGEVFSKTVSGSFHHKRSPREGEASQLSLKDKSGVVARAFKAASERTGAFEARNAKK